MKINSVNPYKTNLSFKARIEESLIINIFEKDLRPKLKKAKNEDEKNEILELAQSVFDKAKEISTWDNDSVKIGCVISRYCESPGIGITEDTFFKNEDEMIIPPNQVKKDGFAKSFLNLKKEDYLEIRTPKIIKFVQKAKYLDISDAKKMLGKDSFRIYKAEYLNLKKSRTADFDEKLREKLELIG